MRYRRMWTPTANCTPFPACHLTRQDWGVPIVVTPDGPDRLPLILRGLDS